jgi:hypothetical protein
LLAFSSESSVFQSPIKNIKIYKTITLPVVIHGYETWSLTLKEEHRFRVFENMVMRIFEPKREEVAVAWRILHNEELCNLYASQNIVRVIKLRRMTRI